MPDQVDITPDPDEISPPEDIQGDILREISGDIPLPHDAAVQTRAREDDEPADDVPRSWPRPWMAAFIERIGQIPTITDAAKHVGIDRRTAQRWMQREEAFALAVADAQQMCADVAERIAYLRATIGTPVRKTVTKTFADGAVETTVTEESHISDNLLTLILRRWRPEYRDSYRVEASGPGGGPMQIDVQERFDDAVSRFDAEVVRLAAAIRAAEVAG